MFGRRLGEGLGLKLQRFETKLLVGLGILIGQAADIHG